MMRQKKNVVRIALILTGLGGLESVQPLQGVQRIDGMCRKGDGLAKNLAIALDHEIRVNV
jgi:hypothetical protein